MDLKVTFYKAPQPGLSQPIGIVWGTAIHAERHPELKGEYLLRVKVERLMCPPDWPEEVTVGSPEVLVARGQLWSLYWSCHPEDWLDSNFSRNALSGRVCIERWLENYFPVDANPEVVDWGTPAYDDTRVSFFTVYAKTQIQGVFAKRRHFEAEIRYDVYFDRIELVWIAREGVEYTLEQS